MTDPDSAIREYSDWWRSNEGPPPDLDTYVSVATNARRRSWRIPALAAALVAAVALACAIVIGWTVRDSQQQVGTSRAPVGTVTGRLVLVGGPPLAAGNSGGGTPISAASGIVYAYLNSGGSGRALATARADIRGAFTLRLSPGRYYLRGSTPEYSTDPTPSSPPCSTSAAVTITARHTVRADVVCQVK